MTDHSNGLRPVGADLTRAFRELFEIDLTFKKPLLFKEQIYNILREWENSCADGTTWVWRRTSFDPVGDHLTRTVPVELHGSVTARLQSAYSKDDKGVISQLKKRAYRFLRLTERGEHIKNSLSQQNQLGPGPLSVTDIPVQSQTKGHDRRQLSTTQPAHAQKNLKRKEPLSPLSDTSRDTEEDPASNWSIQMEQNNRGIERELSQSSSDPRQRSVGERTQPSSLTCTYSSTNTWEITQVKNKPRKFPKNEDPQFYNSKSFFGTCSDEQTPTARGETTTSRNAQHMRQKQNTRRQPIYILELYADSAPACKYAHHHMVEQVHTIAVDWHRQSKATISMRPGCTHQHVRFDLNQLTKEDILLWTATIWNVMPSRIDWIHVSFDCSTQSLASAAKQLHRRSDGAPRSREAAQSDITIHSTLQILDEMVCRKPAMLISIENPEHSAFTRHPTVRKLLLKERWVLKFSHHCASAIPELDGKVEPDSDSPALFPQKGTLWLIAGVQRHAVLPRCNGDCAMRLPGKKAHRLLICFPASAGLKQGQRVLKPDENRGRIPMGIMLTIWQLHTQQNSIEDEAYYDCVRCGKSYISEEDELILCDFPGCKRVQHRSCSNIQMQQELPEEFNCTQCELKTQIGMI